MFIKVAVLSLALVLVFGSRIAIKDVHDYDAHHPGDTLVMDRDNGEKWVIYSSPNFEGDSSVYGGKITKDGGSGGEIATGFKWANSIGEVPHEVFDRDTIFVCDGFFIEGK